MARSGSNQKVANSLVVMSSAAVLAVYSAGFVRTRSAADRIDKQAIEREMARRAPPRDMRPIGLAATTTTAPTPPATVSAAVKPTAPQPAAAPHTALQHATIVAPKPAASPAPENAATEAASAASVPLPAAAPEPVATLASAPVTSMPATPKQPAEVPAPAPAAPAPKAWKDGKYVGWGGSRHGDIQATIVIEGGRIVSAAISDCETRYPCDVIERLPPQVLMRQSPNVDRVGGATESADAFYSAVYFALQQAQ